MKNSSGIAQSTIVCGAWRTRIETTLLIDLSEEERSSLAGHVKSCPACAEHFRKYQVIEEFAHELPYYDLLPNVDDVNTTKHDDIKADYPFRTRERREKPHTSEYIMSLLLLVIMFIAVVKRRTELLTFRRRG